MKVEIYSDVVCPWCYIGERRFERALMNELFAAHFTRGGDVSDHTRLTEVAAAVGMDADRVREYLASGEGTQEVLAEIDYARELGDTIEGKVLVDVTNALDSDSQLALGFTTSGAEELQKKVLSAKVVKAFNTVFATHMDSGHVKGEQLSALIAADHTEAKKTVMDLARSIGFDAIDAGPLQNARLLEPMAYLNIQLGYMLGLGTEIGFRLVR